MMSARCVLTAGLLLGLASPVLAGSEAGSITLPGKRAFPESLTATADGTIYAGNLFEGGVLRIKNGEARRFIKPGAAGTRSIEGVYADEASQTLWVCSDDYSQNGATRIGDATVAVKGFDLKSGAAKISLPLPGGPNECNDMAVDAAGVLYVAETTNGRILRRMPDSKSLEVWLDDPRFHEADGGPDGIAFGAPGQLYVNTYGGSHLFRIDIADGKPVATELTLPRPFQMADGLRRIDDHRLVMVEGSGHLDLLTIDGNSVRIDDLADTVTEPAGVVPVGSRVWVSEARISFMFDPAKQGRQPPLPWRLRAFALPPTP